ncbi:MAG TPA: metallophosphoesterase, partial [Longimicrobiaceae bacterium]|nr:metallophosphoesterase [Longimicrobiaceae bacterium]
MRLRLFLCLLLASCAAAPAPGSADSAGGRFRVVVVSDLNGPYGSTTYGPEVHRAVRLIRETWRPDLVLAAGDLVAGQKPALADDEVRVMWAAFDAAVARPLREAGIPLGFTLGNHDASPYPAHRRDRALAEEHWRSPRHRPGIALAEGGRFPQYYSFARGPLFVVAWDASWAGTAGDTALLAWVRRELGSERARAARWRLVLGHLPLYAVAEGRDRPGEVLAEPDSLRALLERHRVYAYVSGHHHAYYPGRRGDLELLHSGALGDGPRPLLGGAAPPARTVTLLDFHPAADSVAWTTYALD